jgi:hypothetical protein
MLGLTAQENNVNIVSDLSVACSVVLATTYCSPAESLMRAEIGCASCSVRGKQYKSS